MLAIFKDSILCIQYPYTKISTLSTKNILFLIDFHNFLKKIHAFEALKPIQNKGKYALTIKSSKAIFFL